MDIVVWLQSLGLGRYEAAFRQTRSIAPIILLSKFSPRSRQMRRDHSRPTLSESVAPFTD
jgi:hypothetical protein